MCSDIFNFISSTELELFCVKYILTIKGIQIKECYVFNKTDKLFEILNNNLDMELLLKLKNDILNLPYPYPKDQKKLIHQDSKTIAFKSILKINCKLGSNNQRRIQCSLNLNNLLDLLEYKIIYINKDININE